MKIEMNMVRDVFKDSYSDNTYYLERTLLGYDKIRLDYNNKGILDSVCFHTDDQEKTTRILLHL